MLNPPTPRPTPQPINAVMLEHIGESNTFEWYEILFNTTPYQAVYNYHKEVLEEDEEQLLDSLAGIADTSLANPETDFARAYYITF